MCSRTYADHFAVLYMCVFTFIYSQQATSELKGPQLKARVNDTDSKPTVRFRFVRPLLMGVRSILNIIINTVRTVSFILIVHERGEGFIKTIDSSV